MLTCTATVVENLVMTPDLTWVDTRGAMAGSQDDVGITSTLTLTFNSLRTLQGGVYSCRAMIDIDSISLERSNESSQTIIVQSKSPLLPVKSLMYPSYQYPSTLVIYGVRRRLASTRNT